MVEVTNVLLRANKPGANPTHFANVTFSVGGVEMFLADCKVFKKKDGSSFAKFPEQTWTDKASGELRSKSLFGFKGEGDSWKALANQVLDGVVKVALNNPEGTPSTGTNTGGYIPQDSVGPNGTLGDNIPF